MARDQRGLTLLEMAVSLVLTGIIVTLFAHQVIGITSLTSNARLDTQAGELKADVRMYLRQFASVDRIVKKMVKTTDFGAAAEDCLRGKGKRCTRFGKLPWTVVDNAEFKLNQSGSDEAGVLHQYYGMNGHCESKDVYSCPWRVSVHSRWVCEKDGVCRGIEFVAQIVAREGEKENIAYRYTKFWNSLDLGYSADVDYNKCMATDATTKKRTPKDAIKSVDYVARDVTCQSLPKRVVCQENELLPIRGTGGGECGDVDNIPMVGICTLAFEPGKYLSTKNKKDFKLSYTAQGENLSRLKTQCEEKWTAASGYHGQGHDGDSVNNSQVAYLPEIGKEETADGEVEILREDLLPGQTQIVCRAVMLKQDQSDAGECGALITVNKPLGDGPITYEVGPAPQRDPANQTPQ